MPKRLSFIPLPQCPCCGAVNTIAHLKYTDRCETCGARYARYMTYKSLQKKNPTESRAILLEDLKDEYRYYKRMGFKVPKDIL